MKEKKCAIWHGMAYLYSIHHAVNTHFRHFTLFNFEILFCFLPYRSSELSFPPSALPASPPLSFILISPNTVDRTLLNKVFTLLLCSLPRKIWNISQKNRGKLFDYQIVKNIINQYWNNITLQLILPNTMHMIIWSWKTDQKMLFLKLFFHSQLTKISVKINVV